MFSLCNVSVLDFAYSIPTFDNSVIDLSLCVWRSLLSSQTFGLSFGFELVDVLFSWNSCPHTTNESNVIQSDLLALQILTLRLAFVLCRNNSKSWTKWWDTWRQAKRYSKSSARFIRRKSLRFTVHRYEKSVVLWQFCSLVPEVGPPSQSVKKKLLSRALSAKMKNLRADELTS